MEEKFLLRNGIDSHQHFWQYDAAREGWITDEMRVIRRDFMPQDLQPLLQQNGMAGCIVVQSDQSEAHNQFLLPLAGENNFLKGIVGWVDLQAENVRERLEYYQQFNIMKGFRHVLQGEADRSLMLQPAFMRGIGALEAFGFTYDILIFPDQLKFIPQFVRAFPHQKFVLNHLAKPNIKDHKIGDWKKDILAVAASENVFCKVSGMVTEADYKLWKQADFIPYLDVIVEAFGINRIMYGSDWPVCLVAATYEETIGIVQDYFAHHSADEQAKIFRENAANFYNLK